MEVNFWAVLFASVAYMVLGWLWYTPRVFGNYWMRLTGRTMGDAASASRAMGGMFVSALITAYVTAQFVQWAGATTVPELAALGFWLWLGFAAMVTLQTVFFEGRSLALWALNNAYTLIALVLMALILGLWPF